MTFDRKKVLITGHTGFKGLWLSLLLHELGAELHGIALPPLKSHPCPKMFDANEGLFKTNKYADVRDVFLFDQMLEDVKPDFVFHLAFQPIDEGMLNDPSDTFTTNIVGCINLFDALRRFSIKHKDHRMTVVNITTSKVYRDDSHSHHPADQSANAGFKENDPIGGLDLHGASKAFSELLAQSYAKTFLKESNICIVNARAGTIFGGGDFRLSRLVPSVIKAIKERHDPLINNPLSINSWIHALDMASGCVALALQADQDRNIQTSRQAYSSFWNGKSFNISTSAKESLEWPVCRIATVLGAYYSKEQPFILQDTKAASADNPTKITLNPEQAYKALDWSTRLEIEHALRLTAEWFIAFDNNEGMLDFTRKQIQAYLSDIELKAKVIF
jgi:CDP-glucose 4,6-dehydratase